MAWVNRSVKLILMAWVNRLKRWQYQFEEANLPSIANDATICTPIDFFACVHLVWNVLSRMVLLVIIILIDITTLITWEYKVITAFFQMKDITHVEVYSWSFNSYRTCLVVPVRVRVIGGADTVINHFTITSHRKETSHVMCFMTRWHIPVWILIIIITQIAITPINVSTKTIIIITFSRMIFRTCLAANRWRLSDMRACSY